MAWTRGSKRRVIRSTHNPIKIIRYYGRFDSYITYALNGEPVLNTRKTTKIVQVKS